MTRPRLYLQRMLAFLAAVAILAAALSDRLLVVFSNNPPLNGLILAVLAIGIVWNLRQVLRLTRETNWIEAFRISPSRAAPLPTPKLLAPFAQLLAARTAGREESRLTLSATATRTMLDSLASRLDESRELSRYLTGLMIFLGLLGTFWGLLLTVGAVSDVIGNLSAGSGDINAMFEQLKEGLARPLHGMSTAFGSSLFGLSGALVLGFLDLTAGQAQNRFFNELEEWLASLTRLPSGLLDSETPVPAYVQALLEQTAETLEKLERLVTRSEDSRAATNDAVLSLTDMVRALATRLNDPESATLLRNIDAHLQRLSTDFGPDLRQELRLLARTVAARAE